MATGQRILTTTTTFITIQTRSTPTALTHTLVSHAKTETFRNVYSFNNGNWDCINYP